VNGVQYIERRSVSQNNLPSRRKLFLAAISDGPYAIPKLTLPFRQRGVQENPNLRAKNFIFANPGKDSPSLQSFPNCFGTR
jgi:hypothetical protein